MASFSVKTAKLHPLVLLVAIAGLCFAAKGQLTPSFYDHICPQALPTIKAIVQSAVYNEPRMGASLLRMHFHDCFVHGCDASVLLDQTPAINSEKFARPNNNSLRGFEVIDRIKAEVDRVCGCPVVSCADILAVTARDSVVALGGPWWNVPLGRRDSADAYQALANSAIPSPFMELPSLIDSFKDQGLDIIDLVALSGAHTIGSAQCRVFRPRIYSDTNIDTSFANSLQQNCARSVGQTDSNLAPLDPTSARFDTMYYKNLVNQKGLLHSDQALFGGGSTEELVKTYNSDYQAFWRQFAKSMVKMGNIKPLTGYDGQIRTNCRRVN
ncbi:hypothetical protein MLD38_038377 [Melastoma candidum]|uniref:Uncharacterized protein n=1 Tax=Melastoma candidum TaxID=119954 RepID=A0ACB9KZR1_9MYRT|nr:hypothetical protein MLD38_038377 [Melastoma candidum]